MWCEAAIIMAGKIPTELLFHLTYSKHLITIVQFKITNFQVCGVTTLALLVNFIIIQQEQIRSQTTTMI